MLETFASSHSSLWLWILSAAVFALAGVVKGVVGLGLPTVSMALLALVMPPAQAALLMVVPTLVTNAWQIQPWSTLLHLVRRMAPMLLGVCGGTAAGAWAFGAPAGAWASGALGVALIVYALWSLAGVRLQVSPSAEPWLGPLVGALSGLVASATGVFVVPAVPYLQALGLQRDELIQAMGVYFSVATLALAASLFAHAGRVPGAAMGMSIAMLCPALLGMYAGQWLRERMSPARFRTCFLGGLVALGIHMIVHAAMAAH